MNASLFTSALFKIQLPSSRERHAQMNVKLVTKFGCTLGATVAVFCRLRTNPPGYKLGHRKSHSQARTQDFEKGGSEYHVAVRRPRRGGGCGSFYTMDDLECQIFIQIYREKVTETIDLSSPSFLENILQTLSINFSLIVDMYKCQSIHCSV